MQIYFQAKNCHPAGFSLIRKAHEIHIDLIYKILYFSYITLDISKLRYDRLASAVFRNLENIETP